MNARLSIQDKLLRGIPLDANERIRHEVACEYQDEFSSRGTQPAAPKRASPEWPDPKPLPSGLLPVAPFDMAFLPEKIAGWVADLSEQMQCPPDYLGAASVAAMGAVLGCRIAVRPQATTEWQEVANQWCCIVGRPGVLKTPAMRAAMAFLSRLAIAARKRNEEARKVHDVALRTHKVQLEIATKKARAMKDATPEEIAETLNIPAPANPRVERYSTDDATYEALGVMLADNPNGILVFRDELVSLLRTLDQEEKATPRGFYLSAWNGTGGWDFDRIVRGSSWLPTVCLSLLGSTQPGKLAEYIRRANQGGEFDDGLIQRFGLLVWPDVSPDWKDVDRPVDQRTKDDAWSVFEYLDKLDPATVGAVRDYPEDIPCLRFDAKALKIFREWRPELEKSVRGGSDLHPSLESHFAKYRKLVPSLALINHLADGGRGPIGKVAITRALAFAEYLDTHARRCYASGIQAEVTAAQAILKHIRIGDLPDGFTLRDATRNHWAGLSSTEQAQAGLDLLSDLHWIAPTTIKTGGRPSTTYECNPKVKK